MIWELLFYEGPDISILIKAEILMNISRHTYHSPA